MRSLIWCLTLSLLVLFAPAYAEQAKPAGDTAQKATTLPVDHKADKQVVDAPQLIAKDPTAPLAQIDARSLFNRGASVVVQITDLQQIAAAFEQTPLGLLLQEPEIQNLWKYIKAQQKAEQSIPRRYQRRLLQPNLLAQMGELLQQLTDLSPAQAAKVFAGPYTIVLTGIPSGSATFEVGGAIQVADYQLAESSLKRLLQLVPLEQNEFVLHGIKITEIKGMEKHFYYALAGGFCIFATTRSLIEQIAERLAQPTKREQTGNLLDDPRYQAFIQGTTELKGVSVFVDMETILREIIASMRPNQVDILQALGLTIWRDLGLHFGIKGNRFISRLYLTWKKDSRRQGLAHLLALAPSDTSLLNRLPPHTLSVNLVRIPWTALWNDFIKSLEQLSPREYGQLRRNIEQLEMGILRMPLVQALEACGESMVGILFTDSSKATGLLPQFGLIAKLKHPKLLLVIGKRVAQMFPIQTELYTYRNIPYIGINTGQSSYYVSRILPRPFRFIRHLMNEQMRPYLALHGDHLLVTMLPQSMRNLIDAKLDEPTPTQAKKQSQRIKSATDTGWFLYWQPRYLLTALYNTLLPFYPAIQRPIMQMFGFRLQIPMAYIPRTESVAKHIHPSEIFQRSTGEQSVFMRKSGMGLELLFALQIARSAARELLFQFPLRRYLAEVSGYLKLVEESKKYIKNKQYDLAARSWENLVQRSMLGAITSVSRNQAKYFADLRQKHQQQLRQLLSAQHRSIHPALANWHPVGDWAWDDGILQALPGKYRPTSIYTGTSDLSNYVLKFEVKNPNPGFSVDLHVAQVPEHPVPLHSFHSTSLDASHPMYHPRSERRAIPLRPYHRRSHFGRYKARHNFSKRSTAKISPQNTRLDFHTEHFAKDRWVPIRIKVEGHRISYWFGLKHYTRTATARNGMFGILVPANAQLLIRNVQIEVPKTQTPTPIIANAPSLQLSLQGTPSATKVGDHVSHLLAIRNRGGLAASNLRVQLRFSKHLEFISANAQPSNIMPRWHKTDRLLTFSPIDALMPKQTLYIRIYTRTIHQGSANAQADISFASMQGEISIHNRIHIASKDDI